MSEYIHIGRLIQKEVGKEKGKLPWLADKIACTESDIHWIYTRQHINFEQLIKFCIHLKKDFFAYYSEHVREWVLFSEKPQYTGGKIDIGALIQAKMNEDGRKTGWLAEKICCSISTCTRIYQRKHIEAKRLIAICRHLKTDFFACYSEYVCQQIQKENNKI